MRPRKRAILLLFFALGAAGQPAQKVSVEPPHDSGRSVTGAFEGWFKNPDGTFSILVGYFNRNYKEEFDIPIGPLNHIEPGGPDRGQPTHLLPRRQWGVFRIIVPSDFGTGKLTWTLVTNGQTNVIPLHLDPLWEISPFSEVGVGNTPPVVQLGGDSAKHQGPRAVVVELADSSREQRLDARISDDAKTPSNPRLARMPPVSVSWSKYRGPGAVTFSPDKPAVELQDTPKAEGVSGKAVATATFSEPGDYTLLLVANDWSGEGGRGFQCCWTTVHVKVRVK